MMYDYYVYQTGKHRDQELGGGTNNRQNAIAYCDKSSQQRNKTCFVEYRGRRIYTSQPQ